MNEIHSREAALSCPPKKIPSLPAPIVVALEIIAGAGIIGASLYLAHLKGVGTVGLVGIGIGVGFLTACTVYYTIYTERQKNHRKSLTPKEVLHSFKEASTEFVKILCDNSDQGHAFLAQSSAFYEEDQKNNGPYEEIQIIPPDIQPYDFETSLVLDVQSKWYTASDFHLLLTKMNDNDILFDLFIPHQPEKNVFSYPNKEIIRFLPYAEAKKYKKWNAEVEEVMRFQPNGETKILTKKSFDPKKDRLATYYYGRHFSFQVQKKADEVSFPELKILFNEEGYLQFTFTSPISMLKDQ